MDAKDDGWRLIRDSSLDIPLGPDTGRPSPTWEVFSENFERRLQHASEYVSLHVSDRGTLERIVTRVVITSPGLMNRRTDDRVDIRQLHASADRLIALEKNRWTSWEHPEPMHGEQEHGVSVGDGKLETDGRVDRATGQIKQTAQQVAGAVKSILRRKWK